MYRLNNTGTRKGTVHILPGHKTKTLCGQIIYKKNVNDAGGKKISKLDTLKPIYAHQNPCTRCIKIFHKQYDDTLQLVKTKSSSKYHIHPAHLTESLCGKVTFTTNTDFSVNRRNRKTRRFKGLSHELYEDAHVDVCLHCRTDYHDQYPVADRENSGGEELGWADQLRAKYRLEGITQKNEGGD